NLSNDSKWTIENTGTGEVIQSISTISLDFDQLIPEWGISVQLDEPEYTTESPNFRYTEVIESSISFKDSSKRWLSAIYDQEGNNFMNWIRIGSQYIAPFQDWPFNPPKSFENIVDGSWAPYMAIADTLNSPAPGGYFLSTKNTQQLSDYHSVHVV